MTRFQDKNYYEYLQVTKNADPEVIEGAYKRLAKKYHPDNNPNDQQSVSHFQKITEAYETLHDPAGRKAYDAWLAGLRAEKTSQNTHSNTSASGSSATSSFYDAQFDFDMDRIRRAAYANYDQWRGRAAGATGESKDRETYSKTTGETGQENACGTDQNAKQNSSQNSNANTAGNSNRSTADHAVKRRKPILAGAFATVAVVCIVSFFALVNSQNGSESLAFASLKSETANGTVSGNETEMVVSAGTDGNTTAEEEPLIDIIDETQNTQQIVYEVTANPSLNVRQSADSSSTKLGSVYHGETCKGTGIFSDDGKWAEIYYTSDVGETGWVYRQYINELTMS